MTEITIQLLAEHDDQGAGWFVDRHEDPTKDLIPTWRKAENGIKPHVDFGAALEYAIYLADTAKPYDMLVAMQRSYLKFDDKGLFMDHIPVMEIAATRAWNKHPD